MTVSTAALSRATAGIRNRSLILNLPGDPKAMHIGLIYLGAAIREGIRQLRA